MGNSIGIVNTRIARASWEVPSVLFEPGTDLYGLYVWHYKLRYKADFFQIYFCWWRRIYSLLNTLLWDVRAQRLCSWMLSAIYSQFGNVTCWVMLKWSLCWLFVIGSFIWSSILVIIVLIICWPKAWLLYKVCFCGRDFVEPHTSGMVKTGKMRQGYEG